MNIHAPAPTLPASMGGNKTPIVDERWLDGADDTWVREYHAHLWSGGEPWPMRATPDYLRRLTVQEAAVLQSFPVKMEWSGGRSARFRQVGNAVPPALARAVAESVKADLEKVDRSGPGKVGHIGWAELRDLGVGQVLLPI